MAKSHRLGLREHERAVHEKQGLGRHRGRGPVALGRGRVGKVEEREHVVDVGANHGQVDRAPPRLLVVAAVLVEVLRRRVLRLHLERRAPQATVESSGELEQDVTDHLALEPSRFETPVKSVRRVGACGPRVETR